jgi:hypothetical protein
MALAMSVLLLGLGALLLWGFDRVASGAILIALGTLGVFVSAPIYLRATSAVPEEPDEYAPARPDEAEAPAGERLNVVSRPPHEPPSR